MHANLRIGIFIAVYLLSGSYYVYADSQAPADLKALKAAKLQHIIRPFVPLGAYAAPLAKVKKDSMVVVRTDSYMDILGTRYPFGYSVYAYDTRGRIGEVNNFYTNPVTNKDSLIGKTVYKFGDDGITMEIKTCGYMPLDSTIIIDTMRTIIRAYPGYAQYLDQFNRQTETVFVFPGYDSSESVGLYHYPASGKLDTVLTGKVQCRYEGGRLLEVTEHVLIRDNTGKIVEFTARFAYRNSADRLTDTLLTQAVSIQGDPAASPLARSFIEGFQLVRYVSRYDQLHRLSSQTMETKDTVTGAWSYVSNTLQFYGTAGRMDSSAMQSWDTATGTWETILTTAYRYGPIQIAAVNAARLHQAAMGLTVRWDRSGIRIIASPTLKISRLELLDLRGGVIASFSERELRQQADGYTLTISNRVSSAGLIAVHTDRGVWVAQRAVVRR